MMRERKNPRYFWASVIFHLLCVLIFVVSQQFILALAFVPGFVRAVYLPTKKLSVMQVGLTEFAITAVFFYFTFNSNFINETEVIFSYSITFL